MSVAHAAAGIKQETSRIQAVTISSRRQFGCRAGREFFRGRRGQTGA
jgi:hypothetical protein